MFQHGQINPEETTEGRVEVGHDVTQHTDGEYGDDTHGQLQAVGESLQKQNTDEREKAKRLQECPPWNRKQTAHYGLGTV